MQENADNNLYIICDACGTIQPRDVRWLHENAQILSSGCGNQIGLRKIRREARYSAFAMHRITAGQSAADSCDTFLSSLTEI